MYTTIYKTIGEAMPLIVTHGRVKLGTGGELRLPWSASGFTLTFKGEAIAIELMPYVTTVLPMADADQLYVAVKLRIDGVPSYSLVAGEGCAVYANGLSDGVHTLKLTKETETDEPLRVAGIRIYGDEPELLPTEKAAPTFKMEVIGDSITCGYGIWGTDPRFIPYQESATSAYAYLAAEGPLPEARLISWSGRGIVKSYSGAADNRFIDFFRQSERRVSEGMHDFSLWQPDVVVINGGTNDAGSGQVTEGELCAGARELYTFLRSVYPRAVILFFYGAMGSVYDEAYRALIEELAPTDGRVHYKRVAEICADKGEVGALGHPSAKGQRRIADELISELKRLGFGS